MKTYDHKCYQLAEYFLANTPATEERREALAGVIQQAIEDFLQEKEVDDGLSADEE